MSETTTPSEAIIQANPANVRVSLTTSNGKKIVVRQLSSLQQMQVARAMGPFHSSNYVYLRMVEAAFMIVSIDGNYPAKPSNQDQIDQLVGDLGDEVMDTVIVWREQAIYQAVKSAEDALWKSGIAASNKAAEAEVASAS